MAGLALICWSSNAIVGANRPGHSLHLHHCGGISHSFPGSQQENPMDETEVGLASQQLM